MEQAMNSILNEISQCLIDALRESFKGADGGSQVLGQTRDDRTLSILEQPNKLSHESSSANTHRLEQFIIKHSPSDKLNHQNKAGNIVDIMTKCLKKGLKADLQMASPELIDQTPVSYTHLTLPTICSV